MKTPALLLALALSCRSLLAGEAAAGSEIPNLKAPAPATVAASPDDARGLPSAATPQEKSTACCAAVPAPDPGTSNLKSQVPTDAPASCCAGEPAVKPAAAPCCAAAPATGQSSIVNHHSSVSAASLYQLDATFTDDAGRPFALASLRGRPVVLTMFFATCNYACPMLVADITRIRNNIPAALRESAQIVLVSFDVARDTPAALRAYREARQLDAHWTLLHGDEDAVAELAALLGVKFKQEADGQFAHSNLITILNAEGEIVHQRAGLTGGLYEAAAALVALK